MGQIQGDGDVKIEKQADLLEESEKAEQEQ